LIAGQAGSSGPLASTRLTNIWVARNVAFIEIAGRAFSGDASRWTRLLTVLRGNPRPATWRTFWREPEQPLTINGVVAFCEAKNFTGSVNVDRLTRDGRLWQERLGAIGDVFGVEYPVYQVITKCDALSFFDEYFRRLPESETNQALGCTLNAEARTALQPGEVFADVEGKRLSRSFTSLFNTLADRRLMHLAHEPDRNRRPAIYEFPREFKRMRPALVQFLTDAFHPHPLRPGPILRGYYLTAVREVEAVPADPGASRPDWSTSDIAGDASRLLRTDATQMFRPGDVSPRNGAAAAMVRRWIFSSDLFHNIVLQDRPARRVTPVDPRLGRRRQVIAAAVCTICGLLCLTWVWSWVANRRLLADVDRVALTPIPRTAAAASVTDLRALDELRLQAARLADYDRNGAPLSFRWGLYAGGDLAHTARTAYFRRFQQLILNDLNAVIVANLQAAPPAPAPNAAYDAVYRPLATHLMISSAACKPDPVLVAAVLKQTSEQNVPGPGAEAKTLIDRQIDFYAKELPYGNPCRITENAAARDRARQYLAHVKGAERIYANILARAEKSLTSTQRLRDLAPNYNVVLNGQAEMTGPFLHEGWAFMEKASKEIQNADSGDACVIGTTGSHGESKPDADLERAVQRLYIKDYIERWRKFVTSFSVARYNSPEDAAKKLDILAGHKSPLLAVFLMTSNETALAASTAQSGSFLDPLLNKMRNATGSNADAAKGQETSEETGTPVDIARTFQPVHAVVPARSEMWVNDKNGAYIDALAQLSHSMQEIARANTDPAVQQAAGQNYDKAIDTVRQIARAFRPVGVQGLDGSVQNLLEQPIRLTSPFISRDLEKTLAAKINGELKILCGRMRGTLSKYPFNASGDDSSLQEVEALFSPANGAIWKFQAQSLADLVFKEGSQWKAKDPAKKPQVTPEMLAFLNSAQQIADVFYPGGSPRPQLTYVLRPKLSPALNNWVLELELDGTSHRWDQNLQKQFTWPAQPGSKTLDAIARIRLGQVAFPVASEGGLWAIFRIMADAEPRAVGSKLVEWKMLRGAHGRLEQIQPGPVQLEIVEFPGGVDIFNPKFFERLQCPGKAVQ
jgi:type VI secretion system protein ImpL